MILVERVRAIVAPPPPGRGVNPAMAALQEGWAKILALAVREC